ncbi:MAG: hypothetical protein Q4D16_00465 [Eubacteriales bacterium]|nr:hypothetical protein [Eubacteriales bacterium]
MTEKQDKRDVIFHSTTILDDTYFFEIEDYIFPRKNRVIVRLCLGFIGIVEALSIIYIKNWITVYGGILFILLSFFYYLVSMRTRKMSYRSMTAARRDARLEYTFLQDKICIKCALFQNDHFVEYREVYKIRKTPNYIILVVLKKPFICIKKSDLQNEEDFMRFLKQHKGTLVWRFK